MIIVRNTVKQLVLFTCVALLAVGCGRSPTAGTNGENRAEGSPPTPDGRVIASGEAIPDPRRSAASSANRGGEDCTGGHGPDCGPMVGSVGVEGPAGLPWQESDVEQPDAGTGTPGPNLPSDPEGPSGTTPVWSSYRELRFEADRVEIRDADRVQVAEIALYLLKHQSLTLGVDTHLDPGDTDPHNLDLAVRRGVAVRDALIAAGAPADRIALGTCGSVRPRHNGRVDLLLCPKDQARVR